MLQLVKAIQSAGEQVRRLQKQVLAVPLFEVTMSFLLPYIAAGNISRLDQTACEDIVVQMLTRMASGKSHSFVSGLFATSTVPLT